MGKLKEFVEKYTPFGIFAAASIALGGIYYYFSRSEGVPVKAEADGILTAEEEKQAVDFFNSNKVIDSYEGILKSFVNDFDVFVANEFKEGGFPSNRLDENIHVLIADDDKIDSVCGEWGGGCWSRINSTIYLRKESNLLWIATSIPHEIGHSFRLMNYSPYLRELGSESNELYSKIKMYCFNREIGARYINYTLNVPDNYCKPDERNLPYILGDIGFLAQANKTKGDLERAVYNILNDRQTDGIFDSIFAFFTGEEGCLECDTQNAINQYPDLCNAYYSEYRKLIGQPHFIEGFLRHMSMAETHELMEYMRLRLDFSIAYSAITPGNKDNLKEALRGFREKANLFIKTAANPALADSIHENIIEELNFTFCGNYDTMNRD